ncbi:MAG: tRNA adenosine(34) deaminase TadA [Nitrospirae bacterium]|nr:tRNA adenosine(34) deaminase TadA [Nitrospirota bacterium]
MTKKEEVDEDIHYMRIALDEAERAGREGEVPVGAVLVRDGILICSSHNLREQQRDPSAHAEILCLRAAAATSDSWRLIGATLYVTKEPCIMCSGALVNSRVSRLVYGCKDAKAGGVDSLYNLLTDKRLNHQVEVVSGVLEDECATLLKNFFRERR